MSITKIIAYVFDVITSIIFSRNVRITFFLSKNSYILRRLSLIASLRLILSLLSSTNLMKIFIRINPVAYLSHLSSHLKHYQVLLHK